VKNSQAAEFALGTAGSKSSILPISDA